MKIETIIAHAAWDERRRPGVERLLGLLKGPVTVLSSEKREHANVWAKRLWREVQRSQADAVICLNDDVIPHPELATLAGWLAGAFPDDVISLHAQFPGVAEAAHGGARLARCYWPSGPAYVLRPTHAKDLLAWIEKIPPQWFAADVNEDGAIASWLWSRQTPAVCSIPALVRHDTAIPSTLVGYDQHPMRTSPVDWDLYPPGDWDTGARIPYVPCPWMPDNVFRLLGDALRGVLPLCGMCWSMPAAIVNQTRATGICGGCSRGIARSVMQTMLGPQPMRAVEAVTPAVTS